MTVIGRVTAYRLLLVLGLYVVFIHKSFLDFSKIALDVEFNDRTATPTVLERPTTAAAATDLLRRTAEDSTKVHIEDEGKIQVKEKLEENMAVKQEEKEATKDNNNTTKATVDNNGADAKTSATQQREKIPNILHLTYFSPGIPREQPPIPKDVQHVVEEFRKVMPDWEIMLWNNSMLIDHFPDWYEIAKVLPKMSWVSNVMRYKALYKFGGFYVDTDYLPIRHFEPLRTEGPFVVCQNPFINPNETAYDADMFYKTEERHECILMNNAALAFPKGHPALKELIEYSIDNTKRHLKKGKKGYTTHISGPPALTKIMFKHEDVRISRSFTFYPCMFFHKRKKCKTYMYEKHPLVYAMHLWDASWQKKDNTTTPTAGAATGTAATTTTTATTTTGDRNKAIETTGNMDEVNRGSNSIEINNENATVRNLLST